MAKQDNLKVPEWFQIQNYSGVGELGLIDWYQELWHRRRFYRTPITGIFEQRGSESYFGASKTLAHLSVDAARDAKLFEDCSTIVCKELVFSGLVTEGSFMKSRRCVSPDFLQPILDLSREQILNNQFYNNRAFLQADLLKSDDQLKDAFAVWLSAKREYMADLELGFPIEAEGDQEGTIKKIALTNELLHRASSGLLPFLDLFQWATLKEINPRQSFYAEAIFTGSNEGNKVERIRKTTIKKHAEGVGQLLEQLEEQVEVIAV